MSFSFLGLVNYDWDLISLRRRKCDAFLCPLAQPCITPELPLIAIYFWKLRFHCKSAFTCFNSLKLGNFSFHYLLCKSYFPSSLEVRVEMFHLRLTGLEASLRSLLRDGHTPSSCPGGVRYLLCRIPLSQDTLGWCPHPPASDSGLRDPVSSVTWDLTSPLFLEQLFTSGLCLSILGFFLGFACWFH